MMMSLFTVEFVSHCPTVTPPAAGGPAVTGTVTDTGRGPEFGRACPGRRAGFKFLTRDYDRTVHHGDDMTRNTGRIRLIRLLSGSQ